MSQSLMKHENESAELAKKLVLMKNQIMEHDVGSRMNRKFAAVKISTMKAIPAYVS